MENRFGVKDFVLFFLLSSLLVMVSLAMMQYDRQWTDVQKIRERLDDQGKDLRELKRLLVNGVTVNGNTGGSGSTSATIASTNPADYKDDPFARIRAAKAQPGYNEGDWLVDSAMGEIAKLTPFVSSDLYSTRVQDLVLDSLIGRDPITLEWGPGLALPGWKVEENLAAYQKYVDAEMAKGRKIEAIWKDPQIPVPVTITFTLRGGARFSDGVPVTADDFVWTFNWIMNEKVAAPRERSGFEKVRGVEKQGKDQVVFKFREPYFDVISLAAQLPALPKHFYEKYTPEQYNQSVGLLMGSGPYRLEDPASWKPGGGQVILVRNDRYWGVSPGFDRVIFKEISNDIARQTAFRNGEIDVLEARPPQFKAMTGDAGLMKRVNSFDIPSLNSGYRYVAWQEKRNGKPTPFADRRVRRALCMLVDRDRMMQELMLGYAQIATGPFSPVGKQNDPSLQPLPYDVEGAKKLLADAGFKDTQGDGVLRGADGKPFRFKLTFPSGSPSYEQMALSMKDAYAAAGIVLEPDPLEWVVFTDKLNKKDFDAISLGWGGGSPESDIYQIFDSSQTVDDGDNFTGYGNPEVDKLIREARRTIDESKRIPLWRQAQRLLYEDQPYMFLWFLRDLWLVDGRIQNVQPGPLGLPSAVKPEWWVPHGKERWSK